MITTDQGRKLLTIFHPCIPECMRPKSLLGNNERVKAMNV